MTAIARHALADARAAAVNHQTALGLLDAALEVAEVAAGSTAETIRRNPAVVAATAAVEKTYTAMSMAESYADFLLED